FRLVLEGKRGATPDSPAPPEARGSPRASPVIGQSPIPPVFPTPPAGRDTPEHGGAARPLEAVGLFKPGELIIPVVGIRPEQLRDTYHESRAEGRAHNPPDHKASYRPPGLA